MRMIVVKVGVSVGQGSRSASAVWNMWFVDVGMRLGQ